MHPGSEASIAGATRQREKGPTTTRILRADSGHVRTYPAWRKKFLHSLALKSVTTRPIRRKRREIVRSAARDIGPSSTEGLAIPCCSRPPMKVIVFQCPCGARPKSRSPRGARPPSRGVGAGFVDEHQSRRVKYASLAHPARPCAGHVRAFLLRRVQSHFEADVARIQEPPHRAAGAHNFLLSHRRDEKIRELPLSHLRHHQPMNSDAEDAKVLT